MRPSFMFEILERAKVIEGSGGTVLHLEKGEPEFGPPRNVLEAAEMALEEGYTKLTPSRGLIALREAVAESLKGRFGIVADPQREVIAVPGAKFGVFAALATILEPGDEVLCPSPFFPPYREMVEFLGGEFVPVPMIMEESPRLDPGMVEGRVSERTKAIILNYPHNPTGWIPRQWELEALVDLARKENLFVISDEVYDRIVFDGLNHRPILSFSHMRERMVMVNSFSKSYAMTGFRLGYGVAVPELVQGMARVQENTTTCPSAIAQKAGEMALRGPQEFPCMLAQVYEARRERVMGVLEGLPKVRPLRPSGALFVFIDIGELGLSSVDLARRLLEEKGVALTPGAAFGEGWDRFIRISLTETDQGMDEALRRLADFVEGLVP